MDHISSAYLSSDSWSESEGEEKVPSNSYPTTSIITKATSTACKTTLHGSKSPQQLSCSNFSALPETQDKKMQGYVSKRRRKLPDTIDPTIATPSNVLSGYATSQGNPVAKQQKLTSSLPRRISTLPRHHVKPVLSLEWHPVDHRLLMSACLGGKVSLWDVGRKEIVSAYDLHGGEAVRDVEWVTCDTALTAGYDCTAVYFDVAYGKEIVRLKHEAFVSVLKPNTFSGSNLVLTGDFDGRLQLWDLRSGKVSRTFKGAGGKILDAAFLPKMDTFVASSDIVRKNAFSQAMNVWDVDSGVALTHQLYFEPFTCPCLRVHSEKDEFLAQSNGNYVILFSSKKPFKLNKYKRFQGHLVSGFDVGFDLSPDGNLLCSASSEGKVHFYDYTSSRNTRTLQLTDSACLSVTWSQRAPSSLVAVSDWRGRVHILE